MRMDIINSDYKFGWASELDEFRLPPGLDTTTVTKISSIKEEPEWLLMWRQSAFRCWSALEEPIWADIKMPKQDLQKISFFSKPKKKSKEDIDPAVYEEFDRLGIPLKEQDWLAGVAVDAVLDSESIVTTHKEKLKELSLKKQISK